MKFKRYLLVLLSMIAFAIVANSLVAIAMTRSNGNFLSALAAIVGEVSIIITGILVAFVITEFLKEEGKKILWFVLFVSIIGICLSVAYVFPFLKSYGSNINAFILITTAIFGMGNLYRNPVRIWLGGKMKNIVRRFFQYFWLFILFVAAIFIAGKFCGGYNIIIKSLPQILIISVIAAVLGEWGCEMLEGVKHFYAENKRFLLTIFSFAILGIISYCTLDIYKVVQVLFFKVAFLLIGAITVLLIILVMIKFVFPVPVETEKVDSLVYKYKRIRRIALWFIIPFALMIILYGIMYIKKPNNIVSYLWMFDGVCYFCIESLPGSIKIKRFSKKK